MAEKKSLTVLIIGDIVARVGRETIKQILPDIIKEKKPDIVIGNAENLAHGKGVSQKTLEEMKEAGIDIFTSGNHIWKVSQGIDLLDNKKSNLLRPANYPENNPGSGDAIITVGEFSVVIVNLLGRVFMDHDVNDPFTALDTILKKYERKKYDAVLVDFHAEATSEKIAFGWYGNGRASVIWGTHTHVPTADARILPKGTGYITDVGMTGSYNEIIGVAKEGIIKTFLTQIQGKHEYPEGGEAQCNALLATIDTNNKTCKAIEHIQKLTLV